MERKTCGTCWYYQNTRCVRRPPVVIMQGTYLSRMVAGPNGSEYINERTGEYPMTVWPSVTMHDWCGEHTEPPRESLPQLLPPARALRLEDSHGAD